MKKALKVIGCILLCIFLLIAAGLAFYFYHNTHWWQGDMRRTMAAGAAEKQVTLPNGRVINYAETPGDGPALLLIHGQTSSWENYACVIPQLSKNWHVYALDLYGHGQSTHDESLYYIDVNGDDIIWFIDHVIGGKTVVAGHSNGALTAAYVAACGGNNIAGVVLEDPPVFSTEPDYFERSFAYVDTYQNIHGYLLSDRSECWPAYYLRRCLWGKLYMPDAMEGIAASAQAYADAHPGEPVLIFYLPPAMTGTFLYVNDYDFLYGEHFYDYSWHAGIPQSKLMADIDVPAVYIHARESYTQDGILQCAASRAQADRAVELIGDQCVFLETETSDHDIHGNSTKLYLSAVNRLLP